MSTAPRELALTVALPDGRRQPVSIPASATAARAAAGITKALADSATGNHHLVVERTGLALAGDLPLGEAGLREDEVLVLSASPAPARPVAATRPLPPLVGPPLTPPAGSPKGRPIPPPPPPPPPPFPAAAWGAPAAAPSNPRRGGTLALVVVLILVVTGTAIGATLALSGGDPDQITGGAVPNDPLPSDPLPDDPEHEPDGPAPSSDNPLDAALEAVGTSEFELHLPAGWNVIKLEETQVSTPPATRTRTQAIAPTGGYTVVIDAITNYDVGAATNRDALDDTYSSEPGYLRDSFNDVDLPRTTGYEWRYDVNDERGKPVRRVNVLFDLDDRSYAVRTQGPQTTDFEDLAALARAVASSVA